MEKGGGRRVVVTSIGVLNSNGNTTEEFFRNCMQGKVGIDKCTIFNTEKLRTDYVGEIKKSLPYEIDKDKQETRVTSIFKDLVKQMLEDSNLSVEDIQKLEERACMSIATSVGSNDYIIGYVKHNLKDCLVNNNFSQFASICGVNGPCYTNTSACAAGTSAAGTAYSLIHSNRADLVIVVGMDPLTEFSCYGFHSLQNMSDKPCKPFDKNRDGINIGEGGAIFIFEEYEHALNRGAKIYGDICGYSIGNDAYHSTSPDPTGEGALRVMKNALTQGGIDAEKLNYINAHGTGTLLNDEMELKSISGLDKQDPIYVSSTKSMVGHCLAGAGAIELAATLLSVYHDVVFPTATLEESQLTYDNINLIKNKGIYEKVNYALSNSFAFGGNSASILVGKGKDT
ncbi:beta-ketoacyl-[acyl-carrier-protein] synthase family protein [Hathewaya histolytica]|uniref:3-oxoacyl-(Acyl carrier protein) synthase II n=1 Tax=Hathewaya histolytica TaxID=1498 RepID=A0A4U9RN73_HATHI|nr:beta-ketoacyl-[acyl-carrier-protein] synthase family protein [Hathewaya histolytica]VTQ93662.1 3-oxoacyl-(acyl carrier protein) synthase II [Hathewaya histolytica]